VAAEERVAVLGFGTMGAGIAQVCAQAGYAVVVLETTEERLADGRRRLEAFLAEGVRRGKTPEETRAAVLERVRGVTTPAELAGCGWVIEAVVEDLAVKRALLPEVAAAVGEAAIIATNTSALSVTELATAVPRPERFGGLHFFNPAPLMRLVEVVRALQTADATVQALLDFAVRLGKEPVETRDGPGFLVNRLLMPYLNQVVQAYDDGIASARDIDTAVELGLGYPMGALTLLDLIGLDTHLHATEAAYRDTLDPKFAPPPLLRRMVAAGYLGRKSGRGFRVGSESDDESAR
jgi:3-hydroxybutyryl-CoA dehydrogenase